VRLAGAVDAGQSRDPRRREAPARLLGGHASPVSWSRSGTEVLAGTLIAMKSIGHSSSSPPKLHRVNEPYEVEAGPAGFEPATLGVRSPPVHRRFHDVAARDVGHQLLRPRALCSRTCDAHRRPEGRGGVQQRG
jgi:hypothetical protein